MSVCHSHWTLYRLPASAFIEWLKEEGRSELVKAVKAEKTLNTLVSSKASTVGGGLKRKKSQPLKPLGTSKTVFKASEEAEEEEEEEEEEEVEEEAQEEEEEEEANEIRERGKAEEERQLLSVPPLLKKKKLMGALKLMKVLPPKPSHPFKAPTAPDTPAVVRLGEGKILKPKPNVFSRHPKPQGEPSKKDKRVVKVGVGNAVDTGSKNEERAVVEDFELSSSEEEENVEDEYYPQSQAIVDTLF